MSPEQKKICDLVKENEHLRLENILLLKLYDTKSQVCNDLCQMIKELEANRCGNR
jgi:hypothetical protein